MISEKTRETQLPLKPKAEDNMLRNLGLEPSRVANGARPVSESGEA